MHMAVEGPTTTQQLTNDDKHRQYILSQNIENLQRWKNDADSDAEKMNQIRDRKIKAESEERDALRENCRWMSTDTEQRRKTAEKEGEMGRGGMMNGGQFPPHHGMPQMMIPHPMAQQGMYGRMPSMQPMQPLQHMQQMQSMQQQQLQQMQQIQSMQQPPMVDQQSTAGASNGMESGESNSRKRPSTTPNYEDRSKRMMMDSSSPSNPFGYPQGSVLHMKFPSHPHYQNGSPYGSMPPQYTPACHMDAAQQQQQQVPPPQLQQMQQHLAPSLPPSFPSMNPSTSTPSTVPHSSPMPSSSSTTVPPVSSTAPSQSNGGLNGSNEDLDALNTDNVDVMVNAMGESSFSGEDLGTADLGLDEWSGASTSGMGGGGGGGGEEGPSSLPPQSNGVVLPPPNSSSSSAPHSNRMPTPGGGDDLGGGGASSSTHPSPMNAFHPSPHPPMHHLINHVNSVGGGPESVQSTSSVSSLVPPRTPTTSAMGPPSDSSTPFPHMAHTSSVPPHLQTSFPMSSSSHTQPSLLKLSPSLSSLSGHPLAPPVLAPPAPPPTKKRTKKAAAPKQPPLPQPPQFPIPGMVPNGMAHSFPMYPSMTTNQFAPAPGAVQAPPPTPEMGGAFGGNGVPTNATAMQQQQQHQQQLQMMFVRQQHMMMQQQQHMRQNGMMSPATSSAGGGVVPPGQPGMIPPPRPPMGISPGQPMMSPSMMQQYQQQQWMQQQYQQRMQQMRYQMGPFPPMDPQLQSQQIQQHQQMQLQQQQHQMHLQQQQMQQQQMQAVQQQQHQMQQVQQQQQSTASGQGSPMVGGTPSQNGMVSQSVSSPFNASHRPMSSPAYSHTSAPFPFAQFPPINPSQ